MEAAAWNCNCSVGWYLDGLHKFFTTYLDTVERTELMTSATPHLLTLLHTYFKKPSAMTSNASSRQIHHHTDVKAFQRGASVLLQEDPQNVYLNKVTTTFKPREANKTM